MGEADHLSASRAPVALLIRNRRRELGLSQDDLARHLGIRQGSLSKVERGLGSERHTARIWSAFTGWTEAQDKESKWRQSIL